MSGIGCVALLVPDKLTKPCLRRSRGFTLAELLIALTILGVIATFTIPKVLQAQQNDAWRSAAKEAAGTIAGAFQKYSAAEEDVYCKSTTNLIQYINYVKYETSGQVDGAPGDVGALTCSATKPCLTLHNGGKLYFYNHVFGNAPSQYVSFTFDPDGIVTNNRDSVELFLFSNGRQSSWGQSAGASYMNLSGLCAVGGVAPAANDPTWFSW